jgi:hypothetical protein
MNARTVLEIALMAIARNESSDIGDPQKAKI